MNWIEPNSTIKFIKNVPLDLTYDHTIYWNNKNDQLNYFNSKVAYTFDRQSYQRANSGTMKVEIAPEKLYDCNYLMFQNTSFGNKWFYAFIASAEYVNNNVSIVKYVIDIMQTWHFNYELGQTYVERQHTITDNPGESRTDEGFTVNTYVANAATAVKADEVYTYCASNTSDGGAPAPKIIDGMPTNLYFSANKNHETIIRELQDYNNNGFADSIISAYISTGSETRKVKAPARGQTVDGYKPKNKKLLTFPYVKITAISPNCSKLDYTYEDSGNTEEPVFNYQSIQFPTPAWILYPEEYRNISNDVADGLTDTTATTIGVSGDAFKAYTAQATSYGARVTIKEKVKGFLDKNIPGSTLNEGFSELVSGVAGFIGYAGNSIKSLAKGDPSTLVTSIGQGIHAASEPDQVLSAASASGLTFRLGLLGEYRLLKESLIFEQAKMIDDYFTRFGYAIKKTQIPNRNARPHWTYVKTIGCVIKGSCPADVEGAICSIYDNGITFWNNPDEIGDYSLDNSPR